MRFKQFMFYLLLLSVCQIGYTVGLQEIQNSTNKSIIEKALPGIRGVFSKNPSFNIELQAEILAMQAEDQIVRAGDLLKIDANKVAEIDQKHNPRLKEIISEFGWPGLQLVGLKGSSGMWLLVQHQDADLEFQKTCLSLLKEAVDKQDAQYRDYAYLLDRVRMNEGSLQVYGTQWIEKEGKFSLYPIEDRVQLDLRRQEAGLCTIEEYQEQLKQCYHLQEKDFE